MSCEDIDSVCFCGKEEYVNKGLGAKPQYLYTWDGAYSHLTAHCRAHSGDAKTLKQGRWVRKEGKVEG